jgi:hypothetical protein
MRALGVLILETQCLPLAYRYAISSAVRTIVISLRNVLGNKIVISQASGKRFNAYTFVVFVIGGGRLGLNGSTFA